jgi:hypothetical protein
MLRLSWIGSPSILEDLSAIGLIAVIQILEEINSRLPGWRLSKIMR